MNYYKQFAEMLGLELEQEFVLTDSDGKRENENTYRIKADGLFCKRSQQDYWGCTSSLTLLELVNGNVKAVPKPWKPQKGKRYWRYSPSWEDAIYAVWYGDTCDLTTWKAGNCFETKEEAETKGKEIVEQIQKEYEEA